MLDEPRAPNASDIPDVLRRVQADSMNAVLGAWFDDARRQWRNAVCLLAVDEPDVKRVREALRERVSLTHLIPAYWALAVRFADGIAGAPQPDLFGGDYENALHGQWLRFAIDFMRAGDHPLALRMVLQATVGLQGSRDQPAAGQSLLDYVRDTPLYGW